MQLCSAPTRTPRTFSENLALTEVGVRDVRVNVSLFANWNRGSTLKSTVRGHEARFRVSSFTRPKLKLKRFRVGSRSQRHANDSRLYFIVGSLVPSLLPSRAAVIPALESALESDFGSFGATNLCGSGSGSF